MPIDLKPSGFRDATALWHLKDGRDATGNNADLVLHGPVTLGHRLTGNDYAASLARGGDGHVALFDGTGWLATGTDNEPAAWVNFTQGPLSLSLRVRAEKPGGLMYTSLLSLVLHGEGLVLALCGVKSSQGEMIREIPLAGITMNQWHDLIVRYRNEQLEFFVDGILQCTVPLWEPLLAVLSGPTIIGGWRIKDPPLVGFPQEITQEIFQRLFTGAIDHLALWNRALCDQEIALLSQTEALQKPFPASPGQRCLAAYRAFHDASSIRDTHACRKLGVEVRQFMAKDPRRPIYHLTAMLGWLLDPAGAFHHQGQYHVFSYRNLFSCLAFDSLNHYVSDDLIHWTDRPVGVWADSEWDRYGIWLANTFLDDENVPSMIYTAHGDHGKIGVLARSTDNLLSFDRKQPVLTDIIHHDGHTFKDGDIWYTITTRQHWGRRPGNSGDQIIVLTSQDLIHWTERGELFHVEKSPDPLNDLEKWGFTEFPYLISFGSKQVLMLGTRPVLYWVGRFDRPTCRFLPDEPAGKLLDYLNPFHCFNPSILDHRGTNASPRRIILAMHPHAEGRAESLPWQGVHLLPRILTLDGNHLRQEPVPEVERLRGTHYRMSNLVLTPQRREFIPDISGDSLEIIAEFQPGDARQFGLKLRVSPDGRQYTRVFYDVASGDFGVSGQVLRSAPYREINSGPAYLTAPDTVTVHLFLDKCLLEVFVNGNSASGIFTADPQHMGLDLFSQDGMALVTKLDIWHMKSA